MKCYIDKEDIDIDFIHALIDRIKRHIILLMDKNIEKIRMWQNYISQNIKKISYSLDDLSVEYIIQEGIDSIIYRETPKEIIITVDDKKFINGVYVSVYSLCKLINYGDLHIDGINIFSDAFYDAEDNIEAIKDIYYSGGLI